MKNIKLDCSNKYFSGIKINFVPSYLSGGYNVAHLGEIANFFIEYY